MKASYLKLNKVIRNGKVGSRYCMLFILMLIMIDRSSAQNPLIRNMYSADPSARVFGGRVYVFPSHDIIATEGKGRVSWFCMEDYHVFSSANLTDWTDHGVVVTQNKIPWVRPDSYSMWAPDCIERSGKYYFYFPTSPKDTVAYGRGFRVGVAVADKPTGPFIPQPEPIKDVRGIDPNVFIDKDGQAYLYWSAGNIYGAKLKENMLELDSEVKTLGDLPSKGLKEGPYLFERNGVYYLTYPHVENKTERLEYAIGDNPLGPFKVTGVIMDESESGCWTRTAAPFRGACCHKQSDRMAPCRRASLRRPVSLRRRDRPARDARTGRGHPAAERGVAPPGDQGEHLPSLFDGQFAFIAAVDLQPPRSRKI